jgi:hypothetical protein
MRLSNDHCECSSLDTSWYVVRSIQLLLFDSTPQIGLGGRCLICTDETFVSVVTFREFVFYFLDDTSYFDGCETLPNKSHNSLISRAVKWNFVIFEPLVLKLLDWFYVFCNRRSVLFFFKEKRKNQLLLVEVPSSFSCYFIYILLHLHMPSVEIIDIM